MSVVVLFEVEFLPGAREEYMQFAASLREELAKEEGFIASERFLSVSTEGRLLSKSVWRDLESAEHWGANVRHRLCQDTGKARLFTKCRVTVLEEIRSKAFER